MSTNQLAAIFARNKINRCALLASTFRSGSTYAANLLAKNGLIGLNWERFNGAAAAKNVDPYLDPIISEFMGRVFPTKIMWPHRNGLAQLLGLGREDTDSLASGFPNASWLFVRRRNIFEQAVSFWRAKKSGRWHIHDDSAEPVLEYSFEEIDACQRELVLHEHLWSDFFRQAGIVPFEVVYEDLLDNPRLLEPFLQVFGFEMTYTGRINLRKQSDAMSEQYVARYTSELYG